MEAPAPAPDASPADAPAPDLASRVAYLEARNRELETRTAAAEAATPKLRDDAAYAPFLAAHDAGAPKHVVAHRMTTAGLDARALAVDRDTPVSALAPPRPRLRDDPRYGPILGAKPPAPPHVVARRLEAAGLDARAARMDPDAPTSPELLRGARDGEDAQPRALRDDPRFATYFKLLAAGRPKHVVAHQMTRAGHDAALLDCDPAAPAPRTLASPPPTRAAGTSTSGTPCREALMLFCCETDLPWFGEGAPPNPPARRRVDLDDDAAASGARDDNVLDAPSAVFVAVREPLPRDDPRYQPYFALLRRGAPRHVVEERLVRAGLNPAAVDDAPGGPPSPTRASEPSPPPPPPAALEVLEAATMDTPHSSEKVTYGQFGERLVERDVSSNDILTLNQSAAQAVC